ncbi:MAG: hypothetical protein Q7W05_12010 [Deltaproteobacteria bacterium]|nr:hypothetical protein [Deltaproteobacteria bacterium]
MITNLPPEELMSMGERYRADYLVEQGGYSLGIAAKDGKTLAVLLPVNFLAEVRAALDSVSSAMKDKTVAAADSKSATVSQNAAFAGAKLWRTKVMHRCRRAASMGKPMPDELVHVNKAKTVPAVISQMDKMTKLLETNKADLAADTAALLKQGLELTAALKAADAGQEVKKFKDLPDAVRAFYQNKGLLYIGLKVINDAGRELHAGEPEKASQYNFSILRRNHGKKAQGEADPAPKG